MEEKQVCSYGAQLIRVKECLICIAELPVGEVPEFKKRDFLGKSCSWSLVSHFKHFMGNIVPYVYPS